MGIEGLLRCLKGATVITHLRELRGQKCAVDAYAWIHRGTYGCATELCLEGSAEGYVTFCLNMLDALLFHGITPIMVFDGARLEAKGGVEKERESRRTQGLEEGKRLLAEGKQREATNAFSRAVDVSPEMARKVILACRKKNVQVIVAPFEADAQLAYLSINNSVDFVISEDSDLLAFGCTKVLYKFDRANCIGQMVDSRKLYLAEDIYLKHFTPEMFLDMCILSGCDYLPGLQGIGVKTAHRLVQKYKTTAAILRGVRFECRSSTVPVGYEKNFYRAKLTFRHQLVYCPISSKFIHPHTPFACPEMPDLLNDVSFLGSQHPLLLLGEESLFKEWADGNINVTTLKAFPEEMAEPSGSNVPRPSSTINRSYLSFGKVKENLPPSSGFVVVTTQSTIKPQGNTLDKYFGGGGGATRVPASIESKPKSSVQTSNPWVSSSASTVVNPLGSFSSLSKPSSRFFSGSNSSRPAAVGCLRGPPPATSSNPHVNNNIKRSGTTIRVQSANVKRLQIVETDMSSQETIVGMNETSTEIRKITVTENVVIDISSDSEQNCENLSSSSETYSTQVLTASEQSIELADESTEIESLENHVHQRAVSIKSPLKEATTCARITTTVSSSMFERFVYRGT